MSEMWQVNSDRKLELYIESIRKLYDEHKYLTFTKPRIGSDRSLPMNALFHKWLRLWLAHLFKKDPKLVDVDELAGIKNTFKDCYYRQTGYPWLVHRVTNYRTMIETTEYTSSSTWKREEMYDALRNMQMRAAQSGCILESVGEFNKLKKKEAGIEQ